MFRSRNILPEIIFLVNGLTQPLCCGVILPDNRDGFAFSKDRWPGRIIVYMKVYLSKRGRHGGPASVSHGPSGLSRRSWQPVRVDSFPKTLRIPPDPRAAVGVVRAA